MESESAQPTTTPKMRTCATCKIEKPWTIEYWPVSRGTNPKGPRCKTCQREWKRMFDRTKGKRVAAREQRDEALAATVIQPASGLPAATTNAAVPAVPSSLKEVNVAQALRAGAAVINAKAQLVLDTLFSYVAQPAHPHHEWALKLVAERLLPRKLYEDLGAKDAGILAGEGSSRPSVTIIVQPATAPAPAEIPSVVVEGTAVRLKERE